MALRVPPLALLLLAFAVQWLLRGQLAFRAPWPLDVLALLFAAAGAAICLLGVRAFHRAQTTVNPLQPETATALVTRGIYRFTRNPMYLGFTLVLLAAALYLRSVAALLVVPVFVAYLTAFQVIPEERALAARFGAAFAAYRQRARRWL